VKRYLVASALALSIMIPAARAWGDAPPLHASAPSLPLANGTGTAIYDVKQHRITGFYTHMFKKGTADTVTADLADRMDLAVEGIGGPPDEVGYLEGTGILREVRRQGALEVENFYFMPMEDDPRRHLVMLVRLTNRGQQAHTATVRAGLDVHVGAGPQPDPHDPGDDVDHKWRGDQDEVLRAVPGGFFERSPASPHRLMYLGLNLRAALPAGEVRGQDVKADFRGELEIAPGQAAWAGVVVAHREGAERADLQHNLQGYLGRSTPGRLLEREQDFWRRFHAVEPDLSHLDSDQKAVYRQSTAFLKMGQVRQPGTPADGQILASIKDKWARCWIRDASYAIVGLVRSGHLEEARRALEFVLSARRDPRYLPMINQDLPEGRKLDDYLVSICRYYGNGIEESDWNDHGPNIEYDGWGLFLWAFSEYSRALPADQRQDFFTQHLGRVQDKVVTPLLRLVDPGTGLVRPDSSIWEHHWTLPLEYDGRRHYAYTTITAAHGLRSLTGLLEGKAARQCRESADALQQGLLRHLRNADGSIASSLEDLRQDPELAYDAATLEAVNWGLTADPRVVDRTVRRLRSATPGSVGVMRNDDGNWYDRQEWLLLDLRAVEAWQRLGRPQEARALLDWVTAWSRANYNGIGELLDEKGDFQGPFPMCGFGPGAYVLATEALRPATPTAGNPTGRRAPCQGGCRR